MMPRTPDIAKAPKWCIAGVSQGVCCLKSRFACMLSINLAMRLWPLARKPHPELAAQRRNGPGLDQGSACRREASPDCGAAPEQPSSREQTFAFGVDMPLNGPQNWRAFRFCGNIRLVAEESVPADLPRAFAVALTEAGGRLRIVRLLCRMFGSLVAPPSASEEFRSWLLLGA
jgi:hypothetical protein